MDIYSREILIPKREVILQTPPQPALTAMVVEVEEKIFWTSLPRDGRQVLVLVENQSLKVGVSLKKGFYMAETRVVSVGKDTNRFYGLAIPDKFVVSQERQFIRVDYPATVTFTADNLMANSALINFSAGGLMAYLVKDLQKILESGKEIKASFNIGNTSFEVNVRPAWKKVYDNIPFAGFQFVDIPASLQETLDNAALAFNR